MNDGSQDVGNADNNTPSHYEPARLTMRTVAFALDAILILALSMTYIQFTYSQEDLNVYVTYMNQILEAAEHGETFDLSQAEGHDVVARIASASVSAMLITFWVYFTLSEFFMRGGSLGKKVFSMQVIRRYSRQQPTLLNSFLRAGVKSLSFLAFMSLLGALFAPQAATPFLLLAINYFIPFFRSDRRAIHDLISRTWVVLPSNSKLLDEIT